MDEQSNTADNADDAQIAAARATGQQRLLTPRAIAARYLPARDRVEIVDCGLGLHWPAIDEDWYVPAVIETLAIPHAA